MKKRTISTIIAFVVIVAIIVLKSAQSDPYDKVKLKKYLKTL